MDGSWPACAGWGGGLEGGLVVVGETPNSDVTLSRVTWGLQARPSGAPGISPHTAYEGGSSQQAAPWVFCCQAELRNIPRLHTGGLGLLPLGAVLEATSVGTPEDASVPENSSTRHAATESLLGLGGGGWSSWKSCGKQGS